MSKKTVGIVLIVLGTLAVILSLGADALGLGRNAGAGWKQAVGAAVGVIVLAVGAWFWPGFPQSRLLTDNGGLPRRRTARRAGTRGAARKSDNSGAASRSRKQARPQK